MTTGSELRERAAKLGGADFARQCRDLLFDVENEYWLKLYALFGEAGDGRKELDAPSLEWAQGYARAAIGDLERLAEALEARREAMQWKRMES